MTDSREIFLVEFSFFILQFLEVGHKVPIKLEINLIEFKALILLPLPLLLLLHLLHRLHPRHFHIWQVQHAF